MRRFKRQRKRHVQAMHKDRHNLPPHQFRWVSLRKARLGLKQARISFHLQIYHTGKAGGQNSRAYQMRRKTSPSRAEI